MKKNIWIAVKILITILIAVAAYYIGVIGMLFALSWTGSLHIFRSLVAIYVILVLYIFLVVWIKKYRKRITKIFAGMEIIAAAVFIAFTLHNSYVENLPKVEDYLDLSLYQVHSGERVAALDIPSDLKLTRDLPVIDCATALYPVASAFVQAVYPPGEYPHYESVYSEEDFSLYCSGTPSAYRNLIDGSVDIIIVAGPSEEQLLQAAEVGVELNMTPIGREAFVFFVNSKNPVESLTVEEIQGIYSGQITNWRDIGGTNSAIRAFQRNEGSGSQTALLRFMEGKDLIKAPKENTIYVMEGIVERVSDYRNYKNAIGFSFRFFSTEMVKNDEIHLLSINGIAPSKETIRNDTYPISSPFYAVTRTDNENPNVNALIKWILSPQGQYLIEETGYVGIG